MSPGSNTESYPAFAHIGLRENPGKNLNQITCPDWESNPGHLVSRLDALTMRLWWAVHKLRPQFYTSNLTCPNPMFPNLLCFRGPRAAWRIMFSPKLVLVIDGLLFFMYCYRLFNCSFKAYGGIDDNCSVISSINGNDVNSQRISIFCKAVDFLVNLVEGRNSNKFSYCMVSSIPDEIVFAEVEGARLALNPSKDVSPSTAGSSNSVAAETTATVTTAASVDYTRKRRNVVMKEHSDSLFQLQRMKAKVTEIVLREQLIDIELAKNIKGQRSRKRLEEMLNELCEESMADEMALGRRRGTNASYQMGTHGDTVGSKNWLEKPWTTENQMGRRVQVAARRTVDQNRTPKNTVEGRSQSTLNGSNNQC
ncbi:hypothetical protein ANN_09477 [Periplaneta americana]|uniref:Uncharacterized protein n=1 Tax=Periplaneta americana TaxID=6978 RepID=A0ABQ8TNZ9_PERAM|nr:hypothetical protein ANN_09477 [Periplaneta americana]